MHVLRLVAMPEQRDQLRPVEQHLQQLDVHIVDVLSHLEALLRHSHSIQRALLQLRAEAPPPAPAPAVAIMTTLTTHAHQMGRECDMLAEIIGDLTADLETLPSAAATDGAGRSVR